MLESFHSSNVVLKDTPDESRQDQNMQSPPRFFPSLLEGWIREQGNLLFFLFYYF